MKLLPFTARGSAIFEHNDNYIYFRRSISHIVLKFQICSPLQHKYRPVQTSSKSPVIFPFHNLKAKKITAMSVVLYLINNHVNSHQLSRCWLENQIQVRYRQIEKVILSYRAAGFGAQFEDISGTNLYSIK